MLINRSHKTWFLFTAIVTLLLTVSYGFYVSLDPSGPSGGSVIGMTYGSLALALMIFASLLGVRKKVPACRIGRATTWMKAHLWLSLLLIPLVFFHSGFQVGGPLTLWIWILFSLVMMSGLVGALFQHFLPRLMTEQIAMETVYDQIDHVVSQLRYDADMLVSLLSGPLGIEIPIPEGIATAKAKPTPPLEGGDLLKKFYLERVRPSLDPRSRLEDYFDSKERIETFFEQAKLSLLPVFHEALGTLKSLMEERRQLARQKRLHRWLHGWLFAHMPVSVALMVLIAVHVFTSLWY